MFNVYVDYGQKSVSLSSLGECIQWIKDNCLDHALSYGSNKVIYWINRDGWGKAICEITYLYSHDMLQLVFVGEYGELCGSHKFVHQLKF